MKVCVRLIQRETPRIFRAAGAEHWWRFFSHITGGPGISSVAFPKKQKSLDPEFCEELVEKIDLHNMQCSPHVEILDCG